MCDLVYCPSHDASYDNIVLLVTDLYPTQATLSGRSTQHEHPVITQPQHNMTRIPQQGCIWSRKTSLQSLSILDLGFFQSFSDMISDISRRITEINSNDTRQG